MKRVTFMLMVAVLLSACGNKEPATITQEEFSQLETGMTTEEVKEIVGGDPKEIKEHEGLLTVDYEYDGEDGIEENSDVLLGFKDDKLNLIIESGLITERKSSQESSVNDEVESNEGPKEGMTVDEAKEIIEYSAMGDEDELIDLTIEDGEIMAVIDLAPHELLPQENIATSSYSQVSDILLEHDNWQTLTIEYVDIGIISMDRTEKETNEYGDYFPTAVIDERLK